MSSRSSRHKVVAHEAEALDEQDEEDGSDTYPRKADITTGFEKKKMDSLASVHNDLEESSECRTLGFCVNTPNQCMRVWQPLQDTHAKFGDKTKGVANTRHLPLQLPLFRRILVRTLTHERLNTRMRWRCESHNIDHSMFWLRTMLSFG